MEMFMNMVMTFFLWRITWEIDRELLLINVAVMMKNYLLLIYVTPDLVVQIVDILWIFLPNIVVFAQENYGSENESALPCSPGPVIVGWFMNQPTMRAKTCTPLLPPLLPYSTFVIDEQRMDANRGNSIISNILDLAN